VVLALGAVTAAACGGEKRPPKPDPKAVQRTLLSEDPVERARAVSSLRVLRDEEARRSVGVLGLALADTDRGVREAAVEVLGEIGKAAALALPALMVALRDPDDYVRFKAAKALAGLGPLAKSALPELEVMARDDGTELGGYWAKEAVRRIRAGS
jgi:HEAT repeat protein